MMEPVGHKLLVLIYLLGLVYESILWRMIVHGIGDTPVLRLVKKQRECYVHLVRNIMLIVMYTSHYFLNLSVVNFGGQTIFPAFSQRLHAALFLSLISYSAGNCVPWRAATNRGLNSLAPLSLVACSGSQWLQPIL
ncbi:hypothetical protein B0O99DRAFT_235184 [Bisporella sp. PMI_857]|nr:hypothetical protein B0O99DRAFT_235184 [Bisporella sp. PMI_857]